MRLLIMDDESAARYGMRRTLEAAYRIVEAGSADDVRRRRRKRDHASEGEEYLKQMVA